jgi:hypothetical protein
MPAVAAWTRLSACLVAVPFRARSTFGSSPFDWDAEYFRAQILDVKDRSRGIDSKWGPRWARFYPVRVDGEDAFALRFESEHYDLRFMELIAPRKLRDMVHGPAVRVERC